MKIIIAILLTISVICSCNSPLPITGNPDKSTSNSGTGGSAKMTGELPGKRGTAGQTTDTGKLRGPIKIDTVKTKKDSLR